MAATRLRLLVFMQELKRWERKKFLARCCASSFARVPAGTNDFSGSSTSHRRVLYERPRGNKKHSKMKKGNLTFLVISLLIYINSFTQELPNQTGYKDGDKAFVKMLSTYLDPQILYGYGQNCLIYTCVYLNKSGDWIR